MRSRREFLRFVAGSPLLAAAAEQNAGVLKSPKDALNVMDFEEAARKALPPAHYGYLATGVDDDATLRANREGYKRIQIRPKRMVDVSSNADLSVQIFGKKWQAPVVICPVGSQNAFHPEGELAVARAAAVAHSAAIWSRARPNRSAPRRRSTTGECLGERLRVDARQL